jgi:hypothetical protein
VVVDTLGPILIARRDSLTGSVNDLDALITRVETAPLAASYRALAESPQLTSNPRVKALLDSLTDIERDRDAFGAAGGTDPVYVALTSRATEIGRAIQNVLRTDARRSAADCQHERADDSADGGPNAGCRHVRVDHGRDSGAVADVAGDHRVSRAGEGAEFDRASAGKGDAS